ncbi:MAG: hypothetical protein HAW66_09805, partial [Shewanella sp.]|nr:hypothetical protein [Shewanella sp.]
KKVQAYINYLMFRYQSAAKSEPTLISSNSSFSGLDNVHHALNDLLHLWNRDDFREGHTLLTELKGTLGDSTFSFYKLDELQDIFTRQLAFTEQR